MKQIQKHIAGALAIAALSAIGSGCVVTTNVGSSAWYDVYGNYCGTGTPRPGCNYYWDGSKVEDWDDPYYYSSHNLSFRAWVYTDSYGYSRTYYGWGWLSPTGILYTNNGNALNSGEEDEGRDVIGDAAAQEEAVVAHVGKEFAAKYALAETTGVQIAKTLNDWATLSMRENRARTEKDIADFSKRLYGVSISDTQKALASAKAGNSQDLENLNERVAQHWGTSPATSKAILKSFYKKQLGDAGIR